MGACLHFGYRAALVHRRWILLASDEAVDWPFAVGAAAVANPTAKQAGIFFEGTE